MVLRHQIELRSEGTKSGSITKDKTYCQYNVFGRQKQVVYNYQTIYKLPKDHIG